MAQTIGAGLFCATLVALVRVAMQMYVDGELDFPSVVFFEQLRSHAQASLPYVAGGAAIAALVPSGWRTARGLLWAAFGPAAMLGFPRFDPQYLPSWSSPQGRAGLVVVALGSAGIVALDLWSPARRRLAGPGLVLGVMFLCFVQSSVLGWLVAAGAVVVVGWFDARRRNARVSWAGAAGLFSCAALAIAAAILIQSRTRIEISAVEVDLLEVFRRGRDPSADHGDPGAVRAGSLMPNDDFRVSGGNQPALLMTPPAEVELSVATALEEEEQELCFSVGVDANSPVPNESGPPAEVEFAVEVDGRKLWSRRLAVAPRAARRWLDGSIALPASAGAITIRLRTSFVGAELKGTIAGFGRPRIARQLTRRRKESSADALNVVVVLVDTLRADHLSVYGYARNTSPFVETLAGQGVTYESAISTSSWTWPAVASLLTGLDPASHGVLSPDRCFLDDSMVSIAERLTAAGISTLGCASNPLICRAKNFDQGFEEWREFKFKPADWVATEFETWLRKRRRHQFFAYLHFIDPHHPYAPPITQQREFAREGVDVRLNDGFAENTRQFMLGRSAKVPDEARTGDLVDLYDGEIAFVDQQIARVCGAIEDAGIWERTIVVVTADHGEEFRDHGGFNHAWTLYNELLHIPLVIRDPRRPGAQRRSEVVGLDQLPATVLEWMAVGSEGWPGAPPLKPWNDESSPMRVAFSHTARGIVAGRTPVDLFSAQNGRFKLILDSEGRFRRGFDLVRDPREQSDLLESGSSLAELRELEDALAVFRQRHREHLQQASSHRLDAATRRLLDSLGYLDSEESSGAAEDRR